MCLYNREDHFDIHSATNLKVENQTIDRVFELLFQKGNIAETNTVVSVVAMVAANTASNKRSEQKEGKLSLCHTGIGKRQRNKVERHLGSVDRLKRWDLQNEYFRIKLKEIYKIRYKDNNVTAEEFKQRAIAIKPKSWRDVTIE